jgi:hypothetical protein
MTVFVRCILAIVAIVAIVLAAPAQAQRQQSAAPAARTLSAEARAALDMLGPQSAADIELHQGWYRDRQIMYYGFGVTSQPAAVGRVLWPIHGFDMQGNPVAIRGQRPIFSTIPGLSNYSGLWRLTYVVTADRVQPNTVRDVESAEALVRRRRASLHETNTIYNLPITARGAKLPRDSTPAMSGWYEGHEIQFFDFGQSSAATAPMLAFVRGRDAAGEPDFLKDQMPVVDSLPGAAPYPDLWELRYVHVDEGYASNSLKTATAVTSSGFLIEPTKTIRNAPVSFVDGTRVARIPSPLTTFADLRSPFPPAPTVLKTP